MSARATLVPQLTELGRTRLENLSIPELYEHAIRRHEGEIVDGGPLVVRTGRHTGRSPKDKFIVDEPATHGGVWWGGFNQPISEERYDRLRGRIVDHLANRDVFVRDCLVGADPTYQRRVRVFTESAWANLFCANLFREADAADLADFSPNFTIVDAPSFKANPERDGVRSETVILVHLSRQEILIAGTEYAGEMKKGAFGILNYRLPDEGVLPMHAAVNAGADGSAAIFFGLSGTGKTTLSADPQRILVGDDEHGWGPEGVFNFEGGCYAKTIRLSHIYEPDIYSTTRRFGTVLENLVYDPVTRRLDLDSDAITENTRAAFPLEFISNSSPTGVTGHPTAVVFLTADAFGVLPPISYLTPAQAAYHFVSGYTARLAGTEVGIKEPSATFSTCFGAPFMPRHPQVYAQRLSELLERHRVPVWLVNTGWTGGPYGIGERINIQLTRNMVRAAITGELNGVPTAVDPVFGLAVPTAVPDVPERVLQPRGTWADREAYDGRARSLAGMFRDNFRQFEGAVPRTTADAGPATG
jgi:phosphoenolpyruvate carboxykinase (ATP)